MKERQFLTPVTENFLHAIGVGKVAYELALQYDANPKSAFIAGCLHDLGGAIPDSDRIAIAQLYKIPIFKEEERVPMLVHAKQGEFFARKLFEIDDLEILNAILFHTTCIDEATTLTKIVFLADKIHWDRNGRPPYLTDLLEKLKSSLDEACFYFLKWLWHSDLYVIHPFLRRSYEYYVTGELSKKLNRNELVNVDNMVITSEIRKKYYLDEIVNEFNEIFRVSFLAYKLAKKANANCDKAFITAALTTASNTISETQKQLIANNIGMRKNDSNLAAIINCYFAKNEFNVIDEEILNGVLGKASNATQISTLNLIIRQVYK